jgi:hypothetical protein
MTQYFNVGGYVPRTLGRTLGSQQLQQWLTQALIPKCSGSVP